MAESQGGLGDRGHEEGSLRPVFESKQVVFAISGARIAVIASPGDVDSDDLGLPDTICMALVSQLPRN